MSQVQTALKLFSLALLLGLATSLDTTCYTNSGVVLETSSSPNWATEKAVYNEKITSPEPAAIAYVTSQQQVQDIIKCASQSGVQVVPRGGGHGYEGHAVQTEKIVVDVSKLTDFSESADNSSVTFGSGFRLGDLALTMFLNANALIPAGTCPRVGSSGQILGGGTGLSVRTYGLACDQLLGLTMIDYQGNVIQASQSQNQDLLWASCGGGGGNLGIVTSFTVKANSLSKVPTVTTGTINFSGYDSAVQVFDKAQRFFPSATTNLNAQLLIGFNGVSMNLQYFGTQEDLMSQLSQSGLPAISGYTVTNMQEESFINATLRWGAATMSIPTKSIYDLNMTSVPAAAEKSFTAASSFNQEFMSTEGIQQMVNSIANTPSSEMVFVEHKFLGGAVSQRNSSATAFPWRDSLYETQWFYFWLTGDQTEQSNTWLKNTKAAMAPYVGKGAYINYPDPLLAASSDWEEAYYGDNLAAYRTVKTKYDPNNYFRNPLTPPPFPANSTTSSVSLQPQPPVQSPVLSQMPGSAASVQNVNLPQVTATAPSPSYDQSQQNFGAQAPGNGNMANFASAGRRLQSVSMLR